MSSFQHWFHRHYRRPRTTQELRANQDKNDPYVRGRRRLLPTAWDDRAIHEDRSWKSRRKTQYRIDNANYNWHIYHYERNYGHLNHLVEALTRLGCYYEYGCGNIKWYGPDWPL